MSLILKYNAGETKLNKLKFEPSMGQNHPGKPPILARKTPTEKDISSPPERGPIGARVNDVIRLGKLFTRSYGLNYLRNNLALSKSIDASYGVATNGIQGTLGNLTKNLGSNLKAGLIDTAKLVGHTLAQVGVSGTGTHFVRPSVVKYVEQVSTSTGISSVSGLKVSYDGGTANSGDLINYLEPVKNDLDEQGDLIPFFFEILEPTNLKEGEIPDSSVIHFRAYLDSLSDNFNGNWNSFNYIGRGESFYTYQNFDRDISFSFKIAAMSRGEIMPIYNRLNFLASSTAPSYSKDGFMRGTMMRVTIGDYFRALPGFISTLGLNWSTSYPWEIEQAQDTKRVPTVLDVNVSFTPVHTFAPQSNFVDDAAGRNFKYIGN